MSLFKPYIGSRGCKPRVSDAAVSGSPGGLTKLFVQFYSVFVLSIFALMLVGSNALADGGDFSQDFTAAAPLTYDHSTGGGAFDDRTVGKDDDIVESLEGGDFACGDIATFLTQVVVEDEPATPGPQTIDVDYEFTAHSTGQQGVALADIVAVGINYGPVSGGDGAGGTDSGISDDGGSSANLISESLSGPVFVKGSQLQGTVRVNDLEAGENVVIRADVRIACQPNSSPTGNMQARLADARVFSSDNDAISGGDQTIPFKKVGQIEAPVIEIIKTVTTENGDCATAQDSISIPFDTTVKYCYKVTNPTATAPLLNVEVNDDNGTPGNPGDDFEVTLTSGLTNQDNDGQADDLAPGDMAFGEALKTFGVDTIGTDTTNIAVATADGVSASDDALVQVQLPDVNPVILILKEVSIDGGANYFDANTLATAPAAVIGSDALYRITVTNTGDTPLTGAVVSDAVLGIVNHLVGDLAVGQEVVLTDGEIAALNQPELCQQAEVITNTAQVNSTEPIFQTPVSDTDPANVNCVREGIDLIKEVSVDGGLTYSDANDSASAPFAALGTTIFYRITLTNTGSVELENVVINDATLGIIGVAVANLAAGQSVVLTSGDIPQLSSSSRCETPGPVTNIASASGDSVATGNTVSDDDPAVVNCVEEGIEIIKEVSVDGGTTYFDANDSPSAPSAELGAALFYRITLTNTGTADLEAVVVNDAILGIADFFVGNLAAGETVVLTSGEIPELAPANRCLTPDPVTNIATTSGDSVATGNTVSDDDPAVVNCVEEGIDIIKEVSVDGGNTYFDANDLGSAPVAALGSSALYRITVTNTGSSGLSGVVINDAILDIDNFPVGNLAAGETVVLTSGEIPELAAAQRCQVPEPAINTATAEGQVIATGNTVSDDDPAVIDCVREGIDLTKEISIDGGLSYFDANQSLGAPAVGLGGGALYRITLTNTGTADLTDVTVNDASLSIADFLVGNLAVGETVVLTDGEIPELSQPGRCQTPGDVTNIADVAGTVVGTGNEVTDSDPAVLRCLEELIDILKEISIDGGANFFDANDDASAPVTALGGGALYRITVTNTGTADLEDVVVSDAELGIVNYPVGDLSAGQDVVLSEGEIPELDQPGLCQEPGDIANIATASGDSVDTGNTVSDSDPAMLRCVEEMVEIIKEISVDGGANYFDANDSASAPAAALGSGGLYRITLTNTGTADLENVVVNDATLGITDYAVGNLAAGQSVELTSGQIPALNQPGRCQDPGDVTNIAFVDGDSADTGNPVTDSDPAVLRCVEEAVDIVKEVSVDGGVTYFDANDDTTAPMTDIGSGALYRITVTNTGTADLVNVVINDATLLISNYLVGSLLVGETVILSEGQIPELEQPDLCQNPGDVTNIATATGQSFDTGNTVSDSDTAVVSCIAEAAGVLILDEDAIDNGLLYWLGNVLNPSQNNGKQFRKQEVNDHKADEGQRAPLPFFSNNVGQMFKLQTGEVGDEGWFAPQTIPSSWGSESDGLRAFVDGTLSQSQLDKIPDVTPLRATGLVLLEGGTYCAVVYDSDVSINYDPLDGNLQGATLGIAAFRVEIDGAERLFGFSSSSLPTMLITVLDPDTVCSGPLMLLDMPKPPTSSEPFDIDPENLSGGYE